MPRTLCLDFDGVVHSYTSGWKGPRIIPDPPVPGAIPFMHDALNCGWDVCIHSSRSSAWFGRWAMRNWLYEQAGMGYWHPSPGEIGLCEVKFPLYKPAAFITLDDRALTFIGQWPDLEAFKAFKPWNKK